jgi:ribosome-associated protein
MASKKPVKKSVRKPLKKSHVSKTGKRAPRAASLGKVKPALRTEKKLFHKAPEKKVSKVLSEGLINRAKKVAAKKVAQKKTKAVAKRVLAVKKKATALKSKRAPLKAKIKPKVKKIPSAPKPSLAPKNPEALALAKTIVEVATDKKAENITVISMGHRSSNVGYDYVVIATGDSDRQLMAVQEGVDEVLKAQGERAASVEASYDWVCVSYDVGVVAHFFTADRRGQLDLEGQWADCARVSF